MYNAYIYIYILWLLLLYHISCVLSLCYMLWQHTSAPRPDLKRRAVVEMTGGTLKAVVTSSSHDRPDGQTAMPLRVVGRLVAC